jgi:glutamate N-acetyltransferase/amino-acid N-acetyltransferase
MKVEPRPTPPAVRGFRFSGIHGGLKPRGKRDFALIVADRPVPCAAAFTSNRAAAAPVIVARQNTADGMAQAVMVNSGNANAATGEKGLKFTQWSCRELGTTLGVDPSLVIPCSTGVIGVDLERIPFARAISLGVDGLSPRGFVAGARAIMTSDAFPKWTHRQVKVNDAEINVVGMAKGAGMIRPDMATMLSFIVTDGVVTKAALDAVLRHALPRSFNRISVVGDMSTNDSVVLMASGSAAGGEIDGENSTGFAELLEAFTEVMDDLSRMIVRDGEGATKLVDVITEGASDDEAAGRVARAVAESTLVKTAFYGADPNWGRIVCAIGYSGVDYDEGTLSIDIDDVSLVRNGVLISDEAGRMARKVMRSDQFTLKIGIGRGKGTATIVTSDLSEAYVKFNSAYTS